MSPPNSAKQLNSAEAGPQSNPVGKVTVTNPVWNGLTRIRRKDADYYVAEGRAVWIGERLRLVESHPKNLAAAARAATYANSGEAHHSESARKAFSPRADSITINRTASGSLKWSTRQDRARTGVAGSVRQVFLGTRP